MSHRRAERKAQQRVSTGSESIFVQAEEAVIAEQVSLLQASKLTRDIVFAARDDVKISRASTDATGASLTVLSCKIVKLLRIIIFGGGERE